MDISDIIRAVPFSSSVLLLCMFIFLEEGKAKDDSNEVVPVPSICKYCFYFYTFNNIPITFKCDQFFTE